MFTTREEKVPDTVQVESVKIIHKPPAVTTRSRMNIFFFSSSQFSSYLQDKRRDVKAATDVTVTSHKLFKTPEMWLSIIKVQF